MGNITVRADDDLLDEIDDEAEERGISRAELVRECLRTRHESGEEAEELKQELHECQMIAVALANLNEHTQDALNRERQHVDRLFDLTENQRSELETAKEQRDRAEREASASALTKLGRWLRGGSKPNDES